MKRNLDKYVYAVCRLESKYFNSITGDLKKRGYKNIRPIIPTIDRLLKTKKGTEVIDTVPMLFNYGFIRMKLSRSLDRQFLRTLQKDIPGIISFVKSTSTMHSKRLRRRVDGEDWDDFSLVATISPKEVQRLFRLSKKNKVYSNDDIVKLKTGDYITLRGYPYEGLSAIVLEVNLNRHNVKVELVSSYESKLVINISFEHCLYSVYDDHDADKVTANSEEPDLTQIPDEFFE